MSRKQRSVFLKSQYFEMPRAGKLDEQIEELADDFDAGKLTGERFEGAGIVVIGESASGKSKEIDEALKRLKTKMPKMECGLENRILQEALVGETTWKALGLQLLEKLGYPLAASRTEHEIWSRVRSQLKGQGIWLVHIDECQHMFETLGETETKKVINSLKTFMKHRDWPVALILSGIPKLLDKVNLDPQFRNLMTPFTLAPLDRNSDDLYEIDTVVYSLGEALGIDVDALRDTDVYQRISFGHEDLYGKIFRFIFYVFKTLPEDETTLTIDHLAEAYEKKTWCTPAHNVFIRDDYMECNVKELMAGMDE